jgi:hypothetical protein
MQTLVFKTNEKTTQLFSGTPEGSSRLFEFKNTPTVKVNDNYYEVMMRLDDGKTVPVFRAPISNTNMIIQQ